MTATPSTSSTSTSTSSTSPNSNSNAEIFWVRFEMDSALQHPQTIEVQQARHNTQPAGFIVSTTNGQHPAAWKHFVRMLLAHEDLNEQSIVCASFISPSNNSGEFVTTDSPLLYLQFDQPYNHAIFLCMVTMKPLSYLVLNWWSVRDPLFSTNTGMTTLADNSITV